MATITEVEAVGTLSFHQALIMAEAQARSTLDVALAGRIADAVHLVEGGRVFQTSTGEWQVDSTSREGLTYTHVNGQCPCDDIHFNHPPQGLCKHRIAVYLSRRVVELMQQPGAPVIPATALDPGQQGAQEAGQPVPEAPVLAAGGVDPRFVVLIQGKPFVTFAGLLTLAHQRGLQGLTVGWTYNDSELSLAVATAVFPFGTFQEAGDASPSSVSKAVAVHFRRVACTRAAARALRLALGVEVCSVEELA